LRAKLVGSYAQPEGIKMSRSARFLVNAALLLLVAAHAIYWFAMGRAAFATDLQIGLRVAQGIAGVAGALWFFMRSRSVAS
jgi:hypothetical protein